MHGKYIIMHLICKQWHYIRVCNIVVNITLFVFARDQEATLAVMVSLCCSSMLITRLTYCSSTFLFRLSFLTLYGQVLNCKSSIVFVYVKVVCKCCHRESSRSEVSEEVSFADSR